MKTESELRQDIVSGDWIIVAPGRIKRPHALIGRAVKKRKRDSFKNCPFEDPQKSGNPESFLVYPNKHGWAIQVLENKYPAVRHNNNKNIGRLFSKHGPYPIVPGVGHHDIVITRDHDKNFPKLDKEEAHLVFQSFRDRYLTFFEDKYIAYVAMLHNWGSAAGASIYHPHYQIIAIPIVPPDVSHSLSGSARYFERYKKCVHCVMIEWELKEKKRIVFENEGAVAFAPYVSRSPFEIRIFPKKHLSYFENTYDDDIESVVQALGNSLKLIEVKLGDPDYNFFIHTSPIQDKENYRHYHWHIEVIPKFSISAGFELGTGVDINVVDPDKAAEILRSR